MKKIKLRFYHVIILIIFILIFILGWTFIEINAKQIDTPKDFLSVLESNNVKVKVNSYQINPLSEIYIKRNYSEIISLAEKNKLPLNNSFSTNYLVGMSYFRKRQYVKASQYLKLVVNNDSLIKEQLYYYLGTSYHFMGHADQSLNYFKLLRENYPKSNYLIKLIEMEAKTFITQKKYNLLISTYFPLIDKSEDKIKDRLLYFIGSAYELLGKKDQAFDYYLKVVNLYSQTYTRKALERMRLINPNYEKKLNHVKRILLAQYYYKSANRRLDTDKYKKIISLLASITQLKDDLQEFDRLFLLGRAYIKIGNYNLAKNTFQKIFSKFKPNSIYYQKGEYWYAKYFERFDTKKALIIYKNIINSTSHPFMKEVCNDLLNLIDMQEPEIVNNLIIKAVLNKQYNIIEAILFDWINEKKYSTILAFLPKILKQPMDKRFKVKLLYWLGKSAYQTGNKPSAINFFKQTYLLHVRDYYTYKSLEMLKLLYNNNPKALKSLYEEDKKNYETFINSPAFKLRLSKIKSSYDFTQLNNQTLNKSLFLLSLGEIGDGYRVFNEYLSTLGDSKDHYSLVLSKMFQSIKLHQQSIHYSNVLINYLNGEYGGSYVSSDIIKICYPLYFKDYVFKFAKEYNVDPYLALAIIREESRFFPLATSFSGAIGLMQLMPGTGRHLLKLKSHDHVDLYNIELNIKLGIKYLAQLLKRSSTDIALAGYNGGPSRIKRIQTQIGKELVLLSDEHFIELIKITETRNYVKKVLASYYNYKTIYQ